MHNQLSSFVAALKKTTKKPNFTSLATHGMPSGRGKKGSQPPRKRKRNISPTVRTDRIQTTQSLQGDSSSFQSLGCGPTVNISVNHPSMGYPTPFSSTTPWTPSAYHYGPPDWFSGYPSMYSSPTPTSSPQQQQWPKTTARSSCAQLLGTSPNVLGVATSTANQCRHLMTYVSSTVNGGHSPRVEDPPVKVFQCILSCEFTLH